MEMVKEKDSPHFHNVIFLSLFNPLSKISLKINELIQSSHTGVYFFSSALAKNSSNWVKKKFCIKNNNPFF